jgi:hypothetical protein
MAEFYNHFDSTLHLTNFSLSKIVSHLSKMEGMAPRAGIFKQSMGARDRVGIGLSLLARQATKAGGIHSLESIPGLHKRFKIRPLSVFADGGWGGGGLRTFSAKTIIVQPSFKY